MMKGHILMVLDKEFPPDERVEKEISSLQQIGYSVTLATLTFKNAQEKEVYNGYSIYRKKISGLMFKSSAAILLLPFYFRFWYKFLDTILEKEHFDIVHIHDLPLSKIGYLLARKYNLKLVCDQHEYYSNWIFRTKHYNTLPGRFLKLSPWKRYERKYLKRADLVITVENALRDIYISRIGVDPDRMVTLPNTPNSAHFSSELLDHSIIEKYSGKFVLFYAGSLDHLRGIDFILECLSELKNKISNILFLVAGKENSAFSFKNLIEHYHLENYVDYKGWVSLNLLPSYIAASNICLFVPRADNLEINNTIATKIYQYATMGKPVIVSEAQMMKAFVESNRIGYSVHYGNTREFFRVVFDLYSHPEKCEEISKRASEIVAQYTWEQTSRDFLQSYQKLIR